MMTLIPPEPSRARIERGPCASSGTPTAGTADDQKGRTSRGRTHTGLAPVSPGCTAIDSPASLRNPTCLLDALCTNPRYPTMSTSPTRCATAKCSTAWGPPRAGRPATAPYPCLPPTCAAAHAPTLTAPRAPRSNRSRSGGSNRSHRMGHAARPHWWPRSSRQRRVPRSRTSRRACPTDSCTTRGCLDTQQQKAAGPVKRPATVHR